MGSLGVSRYRPLGGMNWAPVLGLRQGSGHFTGPTYKSPFNPTSRTWGVGMRAYFLNPVSCPPPQPLVTASVGKGCIVSWIRCDFRVIAQG